MEKKGLLHENAAQSSTAQHQNANWRRLRMSLFVHVDMQIVQN